MNKKEIHAIEQVLMVNSDICTLYERRGVSRSDVREIFRLATEAVEDKEKKVDTAKKSWKPMKPYSKEWENSANSLARNAIDIHACKHCGHPVIKGYCCQTCGSGDPGGDEDDE